MESFADRLKEELEYLGITRKELAYKANVKKRALDMYLGTQESMPPADVAVRLAKALNVSVEYLVTGEKVEVRKIIADTSLDQAFRTDFYQMTKDMQIAVRELVHTAAKGTKCHGDSVKQ